MNTPFLKEFLNAETLLSFTTDLFERKLYSQDLSSIPSWLTSFLFNSLPEALMRPRSKEETAQILTHACGCNVPVTPRASGTTALYNTVPVKGGILLDLTGLKGVIDFNERSQTVNVQAGTRWKELDEDLGSLGYTLKTYPTSAPSSTVGGWFNTGGLGIGSLKYGCMHDLVKSACIALPDGETRILNGSSSFPLKSIAGAEGTMGVVVQLELGVRKTPEGYTQNLFSYRRLEDLLNSALTLTTSSPEPYHIHFADETFGLMVKKAGFDTSLPQGENLLYVRHEGKEGEIREAEQKSLDLCFKNRGIDLGQEIAEEHWNNRFSEVRIKRAGPTLLGAEILLPIKNLSNFVAKVKKIGEQAHLPICVYGSIVSPHLCQLNAFFPSDERRVFPYLLSFSLIYKIQKAAINLMGHPYGIGAWNTPHIKSIFAPQELKKRRELKRIVDPKNILNPGKIYHPPHLFLTKPLFAAGMNTLNMLHTINSVKFMREFS